MQAVNRQPQRPPAGAPVHYERHRPEQTALYRLVQQHAATFFEQAEAAAGTDLPRLVRDEFYAFLECGILAHGLAKRWVNMVRELIAWPLLRWFWLAAGSTRALSAPCLLRTARLSSQRH